MSKVPSELKYTDTHEWIRLEEDGAVAIGITDHAQEALGDIVFLELPETGRKLMQKESCAVIESVKAASDIYAPLEGEVIAVNQAVIDAPENVNADTYAAWLFKLRPAADINTAALLDAVAYQSMLTEE